jgi:hypothetical protein
LRAAEDPVAAGVQGSPAGGTGAAGLAPAQAWPVLLMAEFVRLAICLGVTPAVLLI